MRYGYGNGWLVFGYPKLMVNRVGVSLQWWMGWRGATRGSMPLHWVTFWWRTRRWHTR